VLPDLENMGIRCYYVHTEKYKCYIYTSGSRPPFDFRHVFLSSVIFVIGGNSAVLKNIIPITSCIAIGLLQ